jgi:hypothetical protein
LLRGPGRDSGLLREISYSCIRVRVRRNPYGENRALCASDTWKALGGSHAEAEIVSAVLTSACLLLIPVLPFIRGGAAFRSVLFAVDVLRLALSRVTRHGCA